jgi:hypothetical protein
MNVKLNTAAFQPIPDMVLEFQVMSHNVGPEGNQAGSSLYGVVSGQLNNPRQVQMALRLTF